MRRMIRATVPGRRQTRGEVEDSARGGGVHGTADEVSPQNCGTPQPPPRPFCGRVREGMRSRAGGPLHPRERLPSRHIDRQGYARPSLRLTLASAHGGSGP